MNHFTYKIFAVLFCFLSLNVAAQDYSESFWYFGNNSQSIQFSRNANRNAISIDNQATPFGSNGSAVAANAVDGQLLFYTDGSIIYGKNHTVIPGGGNIGGDNSLRHPVAIVPSNNTNDDLYYVYFITAGRNLSYVAVDLSLGEFGEVTSSAIGTGFNSLSPMVKSYKAGENYFLLFQSTTSNSLQLVQVENDGTLTSVADHTFSQSFATKNLSIRNTASDTLQLALSSENIAGSPKNILLLELNTVDPGNPIFQNEQVISNSGAINQEITDLEWSVGGQNLYYSRNNSTDNTGRIFQYNPDSVTTTSILNREVTSANALQNGPDGFLYFLYNNGAEDFLSRISRADSIPDSLRVEWDLFNGASFGQANNFPSIAPPAVIDGVVSFDWYDTRLNNPICQNNPVSFFADYNDMEDITSISWDFGNGQTSDAISPNVVFEEEGTFNVIMTINSGGNIFIDSSQIQIQAFTAEVQLQDTTVCQLPLENYGPTLSDGSEPDDITWINPDPEKFTVNADGTATFLESGTYSAAVTVGGCTVTATFVLTLFEEEKQVANFWYFGDGAGIDFNGDAGPQPVTDGNIEAEEGCATVSDDNGELLFYTNGDVIWDSEHNVMANGTGLGGDPLASQGVIAVAHGADPSLYYIFVSEDVSSGSSAFSYALVDMKLNNGLGDVVLKNRRIYTKNTEKISAQGVQNTNVLTHELGSNTYRSFPVNDRGINAAEFISKGSTYLSNESATGYLKYAAGGEKVAQAYNSGGAFIDFLRSDSVDQDWEAALIDINFGGEVYGIEFSPSTNLLYATLRNGSSSQLIQIPVNDEYSIEDIQNPDSVTVADLDFEAGAIQTAPNGQLYIAANNSGDVYTIGSPDQRFLPANGNNLAGTLQPFNLAGRNSRLGLPNFVQNLATPSQEPSINVIANCTSDPIILEGSGKTNFDVFNWTITPVGSTSSVYTSNQQNDTVDVELDPGQYEVALRITNECGYDELLVENIELFESPDVSNVISPRTFCGSSLTLGEEIVDEAGHTYLWSTGETTRTIDVTEEGIYSVTVTSTAGCTANAEIFVGPPYEINIGGDQTVCQDETLRLDAGVNANNYRWFVDDVQQSATGQNFDVNTATPGVFMVRVEVPDPLDPDCFAEDEVEITINETPTINVLNTTNASCGNTDGSITIEANGGSGDYVISWNGPTTVADNETTATNLSAGSYNITITDNLTNCTSTETIALSNEDFTVTATQVTPFDCGLNAVRVELANNSGTFSAGFDWEIFDQAGTSITSGNSPSQPFDVPGLEEGSYSIEVIDSDGAGCLGVDDFEIELPDSTNFNPDDQVAGCGTSYDLEAYLQSLNSNATFTITPNPADRSAVAAGTYTVEATEAGFCPSNADIVVELSQAAELSDIENNINCNGGNELTAILDSGNPADYSFTWSNGAQGQTITVNQAGNYRVTAYPIGNISCADSLSIDVNEIFEPLQASLNSETNCEDGSILLIGSVSGASGNYSISLTNSEGTNIPTVDASQTNLEWNIVESDTYTLTVTNQGPGGCDPVIISRDLNVQETFAPTIEDTYFICSTGLESERSVLLDPGSFGSYRWTLPDGSTSTNRTVLATQPGIYEVILTGAGCEYNISTRVLEDCKPKVFAPNAIRPNGNIAANRTFSVFANEYVGEFQIIIFNRWGTIVYQSGSKDFEWDATDLSGTPVPQGLYAYIINFRSTETNDERRYERRGGVNVLR
ncbi:gliding motility-associated C-terminal domain-containing protein [Marivirga sp. S37H4]|uniref:Gliding motility-associated C-terminal domain-containing protein n=1 Tax=Marivirga aurantiaca TaxID=2802615 RepID=A0A934WV50_9BACT|nr:gliding motility-associated C-terminal domain-containing protein [Marivirga aurantiaca]MBK6263506.1 gliding motility-associated C-terminal domain-containing protein [Marivirga aurantiaca]